MPWIVCVYGRQVHKWKPSHSVTVDFKVMLADMGGMRRKAALPLYLNNGKADLPFGELEADEQVVADLRAHLERNSVREGIVECGFSSSKGAWVLVRIREDKQRPNSMRTSYARVWKTDPEMRLLKSMLHVLLF